MKTFATVIAVVFAVVAGIAVSIGFDLKRWQSWSFGVYGFLTFFLVGLVGTGNVIESIKIGVVVAFATMFVGVTTRWYRKVGHGTLDHIDSKKYPLLAKYSSFLKKLFRI
jgi:hypothetical protein